MLCCAVLLQVMDFLGSAAFSQAVQALDVATGALVCLKIIKNNKVGRNRVVRSLILGAAQSSVWGSAAQTPRLNPVAFLELVVAPAGLSQQPSKVSVRGTPFDSAVLCCAWTLVNAWSNPQQDYFDQSLDEIKLLRYVNNEDPDDEHHIVRLYDFFYYKVGGVQHTWV